MCWKSLIILSICLLIRLSSILQHIAENETFKEKLKTLIKQEFKEGIYGVP